jgi:hypothetical protein
MHKLREDKDAVATPNWIGTKPLPLHLGDTVDDLVLLRLDGSECHLTDFRGRPLVLIFLRHLA